MENDFNDKIQEDQKYMKIKEWCQKFKYINEGYLRTLFRKNKRLKKRITRIIEGKKGTFIDVQEAEEWIKNDFIKGE